MKDLIIEMMMVVTSLNGQPVTEVETDTYSRIRMADSCYVEVVSYPDSFLVVQTACVPVCNSRVRVYNKEWQLIREVEPTINSTLPFAYFQNDTLVWKDNEVIEP